MIGLVDHNIMPFLTDRTSNPHHNNFLRPFPSTEKAEKEIKDKKKRREKAKCSIIHQQTSFKSNQIKSYPDGTQSRPSTTLIHIPTSRSKEDNNTQG